MSVRPVLPLVAPLLAAAALLFPAAPARAAAGEWQVNGPSRVRLISDAAVAPREGELRLGLHFRLEPGWHVYWKNSGDAGYPPTVTFAAAPGLAGTELLWPAPERFELPGGLLAFGYEHEMAYPVRARLAGVEGGVLRLEADLDYLVCEVDCIPFRSKLSLSQPVGGAPPRRDPETAPLLAAWWERLPEPAGGVPGVAARTSAYLAPAAAAGKAPQAGLAVRIEGAEAGPAPDLFLETHDRFEIGRPELRRIPGGIAFRVPLEPKRAGEALPASARFAWTATGLARGGRPLAIAARETVPFPAAPGGEPRAGDALRRGPAALDANPGRPGTAGPDARLPEGSEPGRGLPAGNLSRGLASALGIALLGGLLAGLTPGALALLLGEGLALRAARSRREVISGAFAAAAGALLASWGLALAGLARDVGIPWGAHLEMPALATLLAVASTLLALNLWGTLEVPLAAVRDDPAGGGAPAPWGARHAAMSGPGAAAPDSSGPAATSSLTGGLWRHVLAGAFAPLLALAWPVPLLAGPLGLVAARGAGATLAVATAAALGLALPWLAAAAFPRLLAPLPGPGRRARALSEGLGFAAGVTTLWLLYHLAHRLSPESLAAIELSLLALALASWLLRRTAGRAKLSGALALAVAACAVAAVWLALPSN